VNSTVDVFGIFDRIYYIVESWKPQKDYPNEEDYRNDLIGFLRNALEPSILDQTQHSIQKEAPRSLADIGIDGKVGIELKLNLRRQAEDDRLFSQVDRFLKDYKEGVIVVLCGNKTDDDKLYDLKYRFSKYSEPSLFGGKRVITITKKPPQRQPDSIFDFKL
jgi:hypothetical protein